jgi:hypothetical protein
MDDAGFKLRRRAVQKFISKLTSISESEIRRRFMHMFITKTMYSTYILLSNLSEPTKVLSKKLSDEGSE